MRKSTSYVGIIIFTSIVLLLTIIIYSFGDFKRNVSLTYDYMQGGIKRFEQNKNLIFENRVFDEKNIIETSYNEYNINKTGIKQYNLESLEELESLLTKGRDYQKVFEELEKLKATNRELLEKDLFNSNKIDENRFDDVRTYFKGKELELSKESLAQALATHPEWVKKIAQVEIGAEKQPKNLQDDAEQERRRIFGDI